LSKLADALESGRFVVTSELNPPKGTDLQAMFEKADLLKEQVDAFNVTDSHAAKMSTCPLAVSHLLLDRGVEPIMQMTSRDKNRIALQGDLLGAAALGISNVVFMGGDPPKTGDHPDAKPVFDILSAGLLRAARSLERGEDMEGNPVHGSPKFCLGAVVNPGATDLDAELQRMEQKIEAGAEFFQTQAIYEPSQFERFAERVANYNVAVLAGVIPLKSVRMAEYMNSNVPGIHVPEYVMQQIADADEPTDKSLEISSRIIHELKPMCQGVHIMAIGWESRIPELLSRAGEYA
jgi:5,10-methylenetetrahydrofolate reductase